MPVAINPSSMANRSAARDVCDSSMMSKPSQRADEREHDRRQDDQPGADLAGAGPRRERLREPAHRAGSATGAGVRVHRRLVFDAVVPGVGRVARLEEAVHHLQEAERHQVGAERDAQIDHPARPFELGRHLVGVELVDVDRAERADDAGEQRPAQRREHDHRLACGGRELLDEDVDADMDTGAHPERRAELRHPHEHVGGELLRPGEVDRGERQVDPVGDGSEPDEAVPVRPIGDRHRIAGAVAMHHGDEGDDRRRRDQDADDPLFEPVENAVEHVEHDVPLRSEPGSDLCLRCAIDRAAIRIAAA